MATDGAGYTTSSLYQAKNYDPTALATGLQSAATYDPTQQSTTTPTSAVRFVESLNSQNNSYQDTASPTQNTSGAQLKTVVPNDAANAGLTAASNNTPYASYVSKGVAGVQVNTGSGWQQANEQNTNPSVSIINRPHPGASIGQQQAAYDKTNYNGPSVVAMAIGDGVYRYYQWNPGTGSYIFTGVYAGDSKNNPYKNAAGSQVISVPSSGMGNNDGEDVVNQSQAANIANWNKANQQAVADRQAAQAAAVAAYQAQQQADANAKANSALTGLTLKAPDTSAVDATNQAALSSLISQYASGTTPGQGNAAAYNANAQSGQNVLNHNTAYAAAYDANLANFGNALKTQQGADVSATGNVLANDIQNVQQIAQQLQQEMGQLDTAHRNQVQGQLNQLQSAINNYQQAVAQYGQGSQQAMDLAKGILQIGAAALAGA